MTNYNNLRALEKQRAELDKRIAALKEPKAGPRELSSFSPEEKVEAFDKIYAICRKSFDDMLGEDWHEDNDDDHYIYEAAMQATLGEKIFDTINKLF